MKIIGLNLVTLLTFLLLGLYFIRAVSSTTDTYWHLAIGRQVWQTKAIPKVDDFVYGRSDRRFTSTEWLSGLIYYFIVKTFGFEGLVVLRVITGITALILLYLSLRLITANNLLINLGIVLAGYILAYRLYDRPENFSFVFLVFVNYLCFYYYLKKRLSITFCLLPLIFLLWPNIHAFATVGLGILIFYSILFFLEEATGHQKRARLYLWGVIFLLSIIASVIQYKKIFFIFGFQKGVDFGIGEFMSLWQRIFLNEGYDFFNQISLHIYLYLLILILYLIFFIIFLKKQQKSVFKIFIFYFGVLLSPLKAYRLIPMAILISMPLLFDFVHQVLPSKIIIRLPLFIKIIYGLAILIIISSILLQRIVGSREYSYLTFVQTSANSSEQEPVGVSNILWKPNFPQKAPQIVASSLNSKHLFTSLYWNNYFIWNLPQVKVYSDVEQENRTQEDFDEEKIMQEGGKDWQIFLQKYNIDTVVNSQFFVFWLNNTSVYQLPNWKLVFVDDVFAVYAREDIIKSLLVDLSVIQPELPTAFKFKDENQEKAIIQLQNLLRFDSKNGFARSQLIQYYRDYDSTKAKSLAEESRKLLPEDPLFSLHLAEISANSGNCRQAKEFGEEAKIKSHHNIIISIELEKALGRCN